MKTKLRSPLCGIVMLVFIFLTAGTYAQQVPFHSYPSDGQTDTYSLTPTLYWYNNDSNVGSYTYDVQVSTSNAVDGFGAFTSTVVNITNLNSLSYQTPALSGGTTYYWHVRSNLGITHSAWSTPWSFTTPGGAPPPSFTITASVVGSGTISPSGAVSVSSGANQAFTISPGVGYHFDSLRVDGVHSDSTTHYTFINVTANHTIIAYFSINTYTITASASSGGTITPSGAVLVNYGSNQAFTITPNVNYHLDSLKVDGVLSDSTTHYTFLNVTSNHTIAAYFSPNQHTITAIDTGGVAISPSGSVLVNHGNNQQFIFNTALGYDLDSVKVDGVLVDSLWSYTFVNVISNHTIIAYFSRNNHTWVSTSGNNITGDGSYVLPYATIQKAINTSNPGQVIHVLSGTFTSGFTITGLDDITIIGAGAGSTNIIPSSVISSGIGHKYAPNAKVVVLVNASTNINITGLTIKSGSAAPDFGGPDDIILWNASTGSINDCEVTGTYTISGTQSGQGIGVDAGTGNTTTLAINNTVIKGFQKNGIDAVDGNSALANPGTINLTVDGCTITGAGPTAVIAQNGILVWNRANGTVNSWVNNTTISGFDFTPNTDASCGILAYSGGTPGTNLASVTNSVITGANVGIDVLAATHLEILNNLIKNNDIGIVIEANFSALTALDTPVVITDNSIFNNSEAGLDVSSSTGGPGAGDFYIIRAENNYWGSANGPLDSTYFGTASEMPAGSGNPVSRWVNLTPGGLGNEVVDNDADPNAAGVYVDYYPWDSTGTPGLLLSDISSTTGATVSMNFYLDGKGSSFNTLQGKFTYDTAKLDFLNASYGTGTLVNGSGWTIFFSELTPGTITFAGVGFSPINSDGTLFKLNFEIIDGAAGSADVAGNNADFKANGSQIFGAAGSFDGTISYTHTQQTYLRGDVTLDGGVTVDDALLLIDKVTNHTISTLGSLARQNADADLSSGDPSTTVPDTTDIDINDVLAILQYSIDGTWPVPPAPAPAASVAFGNVTMDQNNLVSLPISVNNAANVQTMELTVKYDESIIDYQSFSQLMKSSGNFVSSAKISEGVASFMYASIKAQNGDITPGKLILRLEKGKKEDLNLTSTYKINGGDVKQGPSYTNGVTGVEENIIPQKFEVAQNYPNPFNPSTTIKFGLPEASFVSVKIYDMLGQLVKTLINEERYAGSYHVTWNGDSDAGIKVTSGAYIYRVIAGSNIQTMKMLLVK